jgi:hypothetical protein
MPAHDGRRPHIDHRVSPSEQPSEQGQADASGVIDASGLDTALDITRQLLAKDKNLPHSEGQRSTKVEISG